MLFGDPALQTKLGGSYGPTAGVTLAGPLTSVAVTTSPYNLNASPLGIPTTAPADSGKLALVYRIKQAYYMMLAAQRNLDLKAQILGKQTTLLKQIQAVYDLKQATLVDLKTAQINARSAQIDVDSAGNDLRAARVALATLMGIPPESSFTVADTDNPTVPVATLDDAIAEGLKRRVELKQLALSITSGEVDLALARGLATPTVSVTGGLALDLLWGSKPAQAQIQDDLTKAGLAGGNVTMSAGGSFSATGLAASLASSGPIIFLLALFLACLVMAAKLRFRPIVMTTLTVLVISFPLILGRGQGSEFGQRMGIVMLGGILFSAVLTFFVVPAAFYLFERGRVAKIEEQADTKAVAALEQ